MSYYNVKINYPELIKAVDTFGFDAVRMDLLEEFSERRTKLIISEMRRKNNVTEKFIE